MLEGKTYHRRCCGANGVEICPCPGSADEDFPDPAIPLAIGDVVSFPIEVEIFNRGFSPVG